MTPRYAGCARFVFAAALLILPMHRASVDEELLRDAWSIVKVGGAKVGYGPVDPLHLAVAKSAQAEGSFGKELTSLLSIVGAVEISVLEVTWKGRTFLPSDPGEVRVRYHNGLFDLSFTAPPGFDLEPIRSPGLSAQLVKASGKAADGTKARLVVAAIDAPAGFEPPAGDVKVDGRPATLEDKDGRRRVTVLREDTLFLFEWRPASSEADRTAFDEFLATVDLDPVPEPTR